MRVESATSSIMSVNKEHNSIQQNKPNQVSEFQTQPTLPIRVKAEMFDLVYSPGGIMNRQVALGTGNILGKA